MIIIQMESKYMLLMELRDVAEICIRGMEEHADEIHLSGTGEE